jgi:hypothetical protein
MNRTIKDATVKRYFYEAHDQRRAHLRDFVDAYNFARRLKTLRGLTPYEFVCRAWTSQPQRFTITPLQKMPGLNTQRGWARLRNTGSSPWESRRKASTSPRLRSSNFDIGVMEPVNC